MPSGRMFVRSYVHVCVLYEICYFCAANKRLDLKSLIFFAYICTLTRYLRPKIFIESVNVLDLLFKNQRFQSSTLGSSNVITSQTVTESSNVIISQTVTDSSSVAIANTKKVARAFRLAYLHLTLDNSKGQSQGHAHFDC